MLNVTTVWRYAHRKSVHVGPKLRLISKLTNADAAARKASGSRHGERSLKRRAIMRPIIVKCESRKAAQSKNTEVEMWRWWVTDIAEQNRPRVHGPLVWADGWTDVSDLPAWMTLNSGDLKKQTSSFLSFDSSMKSSSVLQTGTLTCTLLKLFVGWTLMGEKRKIIMCQ